MEDPIEAARARIDDLFRRADGLMDTAQPDSEFLDTFAEILEELEVAGEELRQQNEELMAARQELEIERARYLELFAFAPDAYLVTNAKGIIQEANLAACEMLNTPYQNLLGKPFVLFIARNHSDTFHRVIARPEPKHSLELRIQPRKQEALDVAITTAAIYDENRQPHQIRWMMRDITERNTIYKALDRSEKRFRAIFQEARMGILLVCPDGKFESANPAFLRMVGYSEAELTEMSVEELAYPDDANAARRLFQKMLEEGRKESRTQIRCRRKDGGLAWADISLSLLRDEMGDVQHVLCMVEDITVKHVHEAELEEMRRRLLESGEVERLRLAQELHDGPMQDLYGVVFHMSDYASQSGSNGSKEGKNELRDMQETIKQVASTLRAVCGELRPPTIGNLGLERAIRSHAESVQARFPDLKIELQLTSDRNLLEPHARMALFRIYQQCMSNLLRHAQATQVLVSFFISDEEITLDVWDNGKGFSMPDKWVELLREGHYGLAGIAERVDALGGRLKIDTKPGAGTLVHVTAPRKPKA